MTKIRNVSENVTTVAESWTNWLETLPWSHWCTGTTSYPLSLASARRLMSRYHSVVARTLPTGADIRIFWVAEPFELRDGHHTHFLQHISCDVLRYQDLYQLWQVAAKKELGWHRIQMETFKPKIGAGGYCSKYVQKAKADFDIIV